MKILHFTYNTSGGAGKVAKQLHTLFRTHGFESALINTSEENPQGGIYTIKKLNEPVRLLRTKVRLLIFRTLVRLRYPKKSQYAFHFNYNYRNLKTSEIIESAPFKPDVIFLHWVADFIMPEHIQELERHFACKIVWRYNDLGPATGGCHYTNGCEKYKNGCGECPALNSNNRNDWSKRFFTRKNDCLKDIPLVVVNSTQSTEAVFKSTPIFSNKRQEFIRNSLDEITFNIQDKLVVRRELGLPADKKIIFWGATYITEERKGFKYFVEALQHLKGDYRNDDIIVVIAGNKSNSVGTDIPFEHRFVGLLSTDKLAKWYQASDLIAVTSLEDGGPMIIVESLMCGRPVVSFATGLANELVLTGETGYRARKGDSKDLASGLFYILNLQPAELQRLNGNSHQLAVKLYGQETELAAYRKLFSEL